MQPFTRTKLGVAGLTVGVVALGDQLSKGLARHHLEGAPPYQAIELVPDLVFLHWTTNEAGFLGLLRGLPDSVRRAAFLCASLLFAGWLVWLLARATPAQRAEVPPLALLLAGVVGNTLDRLRFGYVIDFVVVQTQSVSFGLNVADLAIFFGLGWIALGRLRGLWAR